MFTFSSAKRHCSSALCKGPFKHDVNNVFWLVFYKCSAFPLYVCDFSTGYNLFCKEQVKLIKGVSKISYCTVLAQRWKELTVNQKKEYSARCQAVRKRKVIWDDCKNL